MNLHRYRKRLKVVWLVLIGLGLLAYVLFPNFFSAQYLQSLLHHNIVWVMVVYITLTLVRALFFLPSTIFVLLGIGLFPYRPFFVIGVNMIGILLGASLIYHAARFFTPAHFFTRFNEARLQSFSHRMNQYGFPIVLGWSFFPFVPTDLICYAAGAIRMKYWRFIVALGLGELTLVVGYVYTGKHLLELL